MHTELGRSQVEVPVHTELGSWQRAWRRVGKAEVEVEVDADMVEEKLEEEEDEEVEDSWPRRRRRTTLIKSNNPHLAGGELYFWRKSGPLPVIKSVKKHLWFMTTP